MGEMTSSKTDETASVQTQYRLSYMFLTIFMLVFRLHVVFRRHSQIFANHAVIVIVLEVR